MKRKFAFGQVYLYSEKGWAVVVLNPNRGCSPDDTRFIKIAWFDHEFNSGWIIGHGERSSRWRPHPEPDRIWAEYCAAQLMGEVNTEHDED